MNDFFEEIKKREQKRLKKAIEKAREVVLVSHFPSFPESLQEVKEYEALLDFTGMSLSFLVDRFFNHLPSPLEELRERSIWEVRLSGARHFVRRFPKSFFHQFISSINLEGWQDLLNLIDAYCEKCLRGLADFSELTREIQKYSLNYRKAREIVQQYFPGELTEEDFEREGLGNICRLYASLKSWEKEEQFNLFSDQLEKSRIQFIEIIIEGPIQLYLFIGENWFFILRILTTPSLLDFFSEKEEREFQDLKELQKFIYQILKNSYDERTFKTFKEFVKEASKIYLEDFLKEEKALRRQYPTEDLRRKFIRRFESGEIFKESD